MSRCSFKKDDGKRCKLKTKNEYCHIHSNNKECSICYNKIPSKKNTILSCGHEFHSKCIEDWFERSSSCPLCREEIPPSKFKVAISDNPLLTTMDVRFFLEHLRILENKNKFNGNKLAIDVIDQNTGGVYNFHTGELLGSFRLN